MTTARDLKYADQKWIRRYLTVVGERPVLAHERDEPAGHACIGLHQSREPLRENLSWATRGATDEFAHGQSQDHIAASTGQVGDCSLILPMNAVRKLMTLGTRHACGMTGQVYREFAGTGMNGGDRHSGWQVEHRCEESHLSGSMVSILLISEN